MTGNLGYFFIYVIRKRQKYFSFSMDEKSYIFLNNDAKEGINQLIGKLHQQKPVKLQCCYNLKSTAVVNNKSTCMCVGDRQTERKTQMYILYGRTGCLPADVQHKSYLLDKYNTYAPESIFREYK